MLRIQGENIMNFGNIENRIGQVNSYIDSTCKRNEFALAAAVAPRGVKSRTYYFTGDYRSADAILTRIVDVYEYRDNRGNTKTRDVKVNLEDVTENNVLSTLV